jgi:hypothetical protein
LHALEERYELEVFDYAYVLHYGHHEPHPLEISLKARGSATEEIVEHIPCGSASKEVYVVCTH